MSYDVQLCVNGLTYEVSLSDETLTQVIEVLLERMSELKPAHKHVRNIIFLAGPPAAGKSTLALLLEHFAKSKGMLDLQVAGLDGFHYTNDYLATHSFVRDGQRLCLKDYKGVPESFDVASFAEALKRLAHEPQLGWPVYDRTIHNPVPDGLVLSSAVVLIEGNWLLYDEGPWSELSAYADMSLLITADTGLLHERSVWRKMKGGSSRESAQAHFLRVDAPNIEAILTHSKRPDIALSYHPEADYSFV